jgi:hypothetical protein
MSQKFIGSVVMEDGLRLYTLRKELVSYSAFLRNFKSKEYKQDIFYKRVGFSSMFFFSKELSFLKLVSLAKILLEKEDVYILSYTIGRYFLSIRLLEEISNVMVAIKGKNFILLIGWLCTFYCFLFVRIILGSIRYLWALYWNISRSQQVVGFDKILNS